MKLHEAPSKERDPSDEESSPLNLEPQIEICKPIMISHHRPSKKEVRALKERVLHQRHPYSPHVARHKERVFECKATTFDRSEDSKKDSDGIGSTSVTA